MKKSALSPAYEELHIWNSDIRIEKNVNVFKKNRVVEIFVYLLTVPSEAASKGITGT